MHTLLRRTLILIFISILLSLNVGLFAAFNTLILPDLWGKIIIYLLIGSFMILMWFPKILEGIWLFRIVGFIMILLGNAFVVHSIQVLVAYPSVVALLHVVGVTGIVSVMVINYLNQSRPKDNKKSPSLPDELPYVAAVIPTYGEPVSILVNTIRSIKKIDYPDSHLYILVSDDGHRDEVERMTQQLGVHYNRGAKKDAKAGNLNSAIAHIKENFPKATLILTQDADEIIDPTYLQKTVGYFENLKVGFVQTPKDALAPAGDPFGVRDRVFYDITQPGRNGSTAAFSCGSGVIWRIEAIESIGGFVTWNIVEDLTTSYYLHRAGWHSEYHNEILTIGLAPDDIPTLLKQRGTWAVDNWRLFLFQNPFIVAGLTFSQRLQYAELGLFYLTSMFFVPLLMITPVLSILTGEFIPLEGYALFPWMIISVLYYVVFAKGNMRYLKVMLAYWISHFWTYTKAFWIAIRSRKNKPSYKVTQKTRQNGFYGRMVFPQFSYVILGVFALVRGTMFMSDFSLEKRIPNLIIIAFFVWMSSSICKASLYGVRAPHTMIKDIILESLKPKQNQGDVVAHLKNLYGH